MKNQSSKKTIYAALLLSAFSFCPDAHALPAEKEGVNAAELLDITNNTFSINQKGTIVSFYGLMPERCAKDAKVTKHGNSLMFSMPNCDKGDFVKNSEDKMIDLNDVFKSVKIDDAEKSGVMNIRYLVAGSAGDPDRVIDNEELVDFKGRKIEVTSSKELAEAEAKKKAEEDAKRLKKEADEFIKRMDQHCKNGDFVGLGEEIKKASEFLGDVSELLEKIETGRTQKFKKDLNAAADSAEAKNVYEQYLVAATENGWDEKYLNDLYVQKRFTIIDDMRADSDLKSSEIANEILDWKTELSQLDRKLYKERKRDFAVAYGELFDRVVRAGQMEEAIRYANKAKALVGAMEAEKFDAKIAEIFVDKYKECVDNGPMRAESCERKYAKRAEEYSKSAMGSMGARAKSGDEDAAAEFAEFQSNFLGTFGGGATYTMKGYGKMNQMPGALEKYKYQAIQQYQMQQQQQQMMQMYGGYGGYGMSGMGFGGMR